MDTKDNVGLLYSALKKQGFNDIGDENIFRSKMADENNRKILYEALNKKGFNDIGDYDTFNSKLNTNSPSMLHQEQSQSRPKSPYVEGKGEDTMIFGVPYTDYQQMSPEEQSKQYSAAIEKRKNDEKDFF